MKILKIIVLLSTLMNLQAQDKLTRIEDSNFFSNGTEVFYVMSNKFNSSGFFSETMEGMDTLQITETNSEKKIDNTVALKRFDINTVTLISKASFIEKYSLRYMFVNQLTIAIKLPEINLKGFKIIDKNYGAFNNLVVYEFNEIENADIASFTVITGGYEAFSKDNNHVFYQNKVLKCANPKTFKILEEGYSKDDKYVFKRGEIIENADPKSFQIITYTYQKDKNHVWKIGIPTDIDAKTFKVVTYNYPDDKNIKYKSLYAIDKNNVYFQGEIMRNADVKTFYLTCSGAPYQIYGVDKNAVFYSDKIIKDADSKTFSVIKNKTSERNYDAFDKNYRYTRDIKTIANKDNN